MENVVIIWSGPAGHTAAIYTWRANLSPLMFEWFMAWGIAAWWQLTTTNVIENFPGFPKWIDGIQLMGNMRQQVLNSWVRIETKTVDKIDLSSKPFKVFVWTDIIETKSLIIATWAIAKRMWIPGEEKYRWKWVSACAICDGGLPIFRWKSIVIVWGGDVAMEEAIHLTHFASKVIVLVRRDVLRASKIMQNKSKKNNKIEFLRNTEAKEIVWNNFVTGVKVINNKTWKENLVECSWLFYAIWHKPNTDFLEGQIKLDEVGYVLTHFNAVHTQTSVPGVFAAGDVADKKYRQAITSAWTWCMAAIEVEKYLEMIN